VDTWECLDELGFFPTALGKDYDFGNMQVSASCDPLFGVHLLGHCGDQRTLSLVEYRLPSTVESTKHCAALIAYALRHFQPTRSTPWLEMGLADQHLLPWERERAAYNARPLYWAERDWWRTALKVLRALPPESLQGNALFRFDGRAASIALGDTYITFPGTGKLWPHSYAVSASEFVGGLPRRLYGDLIQTDVHQDTLRTCGRQWRCEVAL
jgi:hypothetical protein